MFRQRTSSQKPGDELLANFRHQFPEIASVASSSASGVPAQTTVTADNSVLVAPGPEQYVAVSFYLDSFRRIKSLSSSFLPFYNGGIYKSSVEAVQAHLGSF
ncbi:hypothetical protein F4804DRAFT_34632 [Jackrogersella minutella]|nr:hypothetical protein F4804DRAFT_34632 [Jackrogersella minutella]